MNLSNSDITSHELSDFDLFFDPRLGIIPQMGFDPLPPWEPQIHLITARLAKELLPDGSDTLRQIFASGHGFDRERALVSATGEALERVFGGFTSWIEHDKTFVELPLIELERLPQFSDSELEHLDERYGLLDLSGLARYPATRLGTSECYSAPAQLVFCPYHPNEEEKLFWEPTANGLASGLSSTAAQIAGMLEVVERDALAVSWLLRIPGQELSLTEALGKDHKAFAHSMHRGPTTVRLALLSLDIPIPVCVAAIYDEASMPCVAFGSGASIDLKTAAQKALSEAALVRYTLKLRLNVLQDRASHPENCDPKTFQEHGLAWVDPENATLTKWIFGSRMASCPSIGNALMHPQSILDHLIDTIAEAGYRVYACDLTRAELASRGWVVQRVIIPGLQPLNPGRYRRMQRSERLVSVHKWLRGNQQPLTMFDAVHPFC